jgi:HEAT repeat protein
MPFHSNNQDIMKLFPSLLTLLCLGTRLLALDAAQLGTVTSKFSDPSGDAQYAARIELNRMIDDATAPGKGDVASAIRAIDEVLTNPTTSTEAKKYLLRALARVGNNESVPAVLAIFRGPDAMLKEEARQVLESIQSQEVITALTEALVAATEPREQVALLGSLGLIRAGAAVPAIAALITKPDPKVALAAVDALGKIGDTQSVTTLGKLRTDANLAAPLKQEIDKALLLAGKDNPAVARKIYQTTGSADVKMTAFLPLSQGESSTAIIRDALQSGDAVLRLTALKRGLENNQTDLLKGGLDRETDPFSNSERLIILANLPSLKPSDVAVEIAVKALDTDDPEQRAAAISALGLIGGESAFKALLPMLGNGEPTVNRAALQAISRINSPGANEILLGAIQGPAGPEKVLAIKAAASRMLPGVRPLLVQIITSGESDSTQEAMKTLYAIGGIEELKALCTAATSTTDAALRGRLASFSKRLASRLGTEEAKQLADAIQAN